MNIAIGPLIKLWRIGFDDANVPSDKAIKQVMKRIDVNQVELDATTHTVKLAQPKMEIDLGALAKGYIADKIMADIQSFAPRTAFINLGEIYFYQERHIIILIICGGSVFNIPINRGDRIV